MFNRFYNYCSRKSSHIGSKFHFYTGLTVIFSGVFAFILERKITIPLLLFVSGLTVIFPLPSKNNRNSDSKQEKNKKWRKFFMLY